MKYNEPMLMKLHCKVNDPIPLGEGAGVGRTRDTDSMDLPEGSTLYDLVQLGITNTHACVGVVVRLREELSLVKDIPVLFAIDQVSCLSLCKFDTLFVTSDQTPYCCLQTV